MPRKKSDRGSYAPKTGGSGNKGHKLGPGDRGTSIIAAKQRHGGPNHGGMPPRKGFPSLPMEG